MSSQFEKSYRVTPNSTLNANLWNSVFQNVDQRILGIEDKKASFEEAEKQLLEVGLRRINETIGPAAQKIFQMSQLGFLVASSQALLKPVDGETLSVHLIKGDQADLFSPSPFIALVRRSTPDDYAIGKLLHYDREEARLDISIVSVQGDMGAHDDWDVAALAGSVKAMWDALTQSRSIRDEVETKHADIAQKSTDVTAKHSETVAKHGDFISTWYGARTTPPNNAKTGAMYLDIGQNPAIVMVKSGLGWIMAAIASDNVYTKAQADAKFLTQENAQFLPLTGGTVTGDIIRTGSQNGSFEVSIPDGAQDGGGLTLTPQSGGQTVTISYIGNEGNGGARIRIGGGIVASFWPNGIAQFSNTVYAGGAYLHPSGNINGSAWQDWHSSGWATTAIDARIEHRAQHWADDRKNWCVIDTRVSGWAQVDNDHLPSGYFATYGNYISFTSRGNSGGGSGPKVSLGGRQLQIYIPNIGWRAAGFW